ncbi:MAG: DUF6783 domain-containing protein [Lachnospiraceae bacterium]
MKNHFRNLQAPLCGIFYPSSGFARSPLRRLIRIKFPTSWDSAAHEKPFSNTFQNASDVSNHFRAITPHFAGRATLNSVCRSPLRRPHSG